MRTSEPGTAKNSSLPSSPGLDSHFAAALRAEMVSSVNRHRRPWLLRHALMASLGVAGLLVVVSGTAVALTALWPGGTSTDVLSPSVSETHVGSTRVDLGARPESASAVKLDLTCLSPGTFTFPDGASVSCSSADVAAGKPISYTLNLTKDGGTVQIAARPDTASWRLSHTYISTTVQPWGINTKGETFGVINDKGEPDLIAAMATNGANGYIYRRDMLQAPTTAGSSLTVPVYQSDGQITVGQFVIGGSSATAAPTP